MITDLQVNGYAGADFNADSLTAESLHAACLKLREHGVGQILATVITDAPEAMARRLRRVAELRAADPLAAELIAGLHIEGPFLNPAPGFIGAHPVAHAVEATADRARALLDAGGGLVKLVTLAPERDPGFAATRYLAEAGVAVAAGHCDPNLDVLRGAIDAGLAMFTHLGNGCPAELTRHDNIVQRALALSDRLFVSVIPDGAHVPFFALKNYLRAIPAERAIAVTDAIAAACLPPGPFRLGATEIEVGADGVARLPGTPYLAGSTLTAPRMLANLRDALDLDPAAVDAMTRINPARVLNA